MAHESASVLSPLSRRPVLLFLLISPLSFGAIPWAGSGGYCLYAPERATSLISTNNFNDFHFQNGASTQGFTVEFWIANPVQNYIEPIWQVKKATEKFRIARLMIQGVLLSGDFLFNSEVASSPLQVSGHTVENAARHVAFWIRQGPGDTTLVTSFENGVTKAEISDNFQGNQGDPMQIRMFQVLDPENTNIQANDVKIDNVRVWKGPRTEDELKEFMHFGELDKKDHPTLDCEWRFENGVEQTYTNYGNDAMNVGDLEHEEALSAFADAQLEVAPGFGLDTFTGLVVTGSAGCEFSLPLLGGDKDGTEVVFVIDAVPDELIIEADSTTDDQIGVVIAESLAEAVEVFVEYSVQSGDERSLKTRAFLTLEPGDGCDTNASQFPLIPVLAGVGASVLCLGLVSLGALGGFKRHRSDRTEQKDVKSSIKVPVVPLDSGISRHVGKGRTRQSTVTKPSARKSSRTTSKAATVEAKISSLLGEFTTSELNKYVEYLLAQGKAEEALALGLKVEEKATHAGPDDAEYLRVVGNVGRAMSMIGFNSGESGGSAASKGGADREKARATAARVGTSSVAGLIWESETVAESVSIESPSAAGAVSIDMPKKRKSTSKRRRRSSGDNKGSTRSRRSSGDKQGSSRRRSRSRTGSMNTKGSAGGDGGGGGGGGSGRRKKSKGKRLSITKKQKRDSLASKGSGGSRSVAAERLKDTDTLQFTYGGETREFDEVVVPM